MFYQLMSSVIYDNWDPCQDSGGGTSSAPSGPPCATGMAYDMNEYCYAVSQTVEDGHSIGKLEMGSLKYLIIADVVKTPL